MGSDLAVGLRAVGAGSFVPDMRAQGLGEGARPVAVSVVCQDPLDHDSLGLEPGVRPLPKGCGGFLCLVGEDLGVCQA